MSSIGNALPGRRIRASIAALVAIVTVLAFAPSPAQASDPGGGASTMGSSSCVAFGYLGWCQTNAVETTKDNRCVSASLGVLGIGNIYDINGDHVGPYNFSWSTRVCGLYNWYYLVVLNVVNVPPHVTVGTISN